MHKIWCLLLIVTSALFFTGCSMTADTGNGINEDFFSHKPVRPVTQSKSQEQSLQRELKRFVQRYEQGAKQNSQKQYELAQMYFYGVLSSQQEQEFRRSYKKEVPAYLLKTELNQDKAIYWLEKAIRNNHKEAIYFSFTLTEMLGRAKPIKNLVSLKQAFAYAAKKGSYPAKAALALTEILTTWNKNLKDPQIAEATLVFAEQPDEPIAQFGSSVVTWYYSLVGKASEDDAVSLLNQALDNGFDAAALAINTIYLKHKYTSLSLNYLAQYLKKRPWDVDALNLACNILISAKSKDLDFAYRKQISELALNVAFLQRPESENALMFLLTSVNKKNSEYANPYSLDLFDCIYFIELAEKLTNKEYANAKQLKKVLSQIKQNDKKGDKSAKVFMMVYHSRLGENLNQDPEKALEYAQLLELSNDKNVLSFLGISYLVGNDLPFDEKKGMALLKQAASKGNLGAVTLLDLYKKDPVSIQNITLSDLKRNSVVTTLIAIPALFL